MGTLARLPLEGGGSVLFESTESSNGPVKAGRVGDAIHDLPRTLQESLRPVTDMARTALEQLRQMSPDEVVIEFGVDVASEVGAVIVKSEAGCHLTVTVAWHATRDTGTA
ncbi:CU044_2847 family protein [Streptomyces massasporeus]|uniref:CU044_2847 family protein n=1 Tax=Streptomyces massasporeus TaxID=67324 RepID=UPI0036EFA946